MRLILLLTLCFMKVESLDQLLISAFNIKVFGQSKISKPEVVDVIIKVLSRYDLVIVQEIRDIQETSFPTLVEQLNEGGINYTWFTGPRVGRTSSKEQYGFVYRPDKLELLGKFQYNDTDDVFEREPIITRFRWLGGGGREFTLIPMHAKPTDAVAEMNGLLQVYMDAVGVYGNNTIILGDLNADCSYVCQSCWDSVVLRTDPTFHWLIGDDVDTTVSNTDCAYDRIIVTGDLINDVCCADVHRFDLGLNLTTDETAMVSDHYPVEVTIVALQPNIQQTQSNEHSTSMMSSYTAQGVTTIAINTTSVQTRTAQATSSTTSHPTPATLETRGNNSNKVFYSRFLFYCFTIMPIVSIIWNIP
nr:deoxyribonuclease-1-like isoform X1 [Ciona intestinalis]|eukprot:XP_018672106.1 deoxyribonuclease-1-like isoform X1 [Ciona intestinalis]